MRADDDNSISTSGDLILGNANVYNIALPKNLLHLMNSCNYCCEIAN